MGTLWPLGSVHCPGENWFPHSLTLLLCCSCLPPLFAAHAPNPQFIGHVGGYYSLIKWTCYLWHTHKLSVNEALPHSFRPRFPKWGTSGHPSTETCLTPWSWNYGKVCECDIRLEVVKIWLPRRRRTPSRPLYMCLPPLVNVVHDCHDSAVSWDGQEKLQNSAIM